MGGHSRDSLAAPDRVLGGAHIWLCPKHPPPLTGKPSMSHSLYPVLFFTSPAKPTGVSLRLAGNLRLGEFSDTSLALTRFLMDSSPCCRPLPLLAKYEAGKSMERPLLCLLGRHLLLRVESCRSWPCCPLWDSCREPAVCATRVGVADRGPCSGPEGCWGSGAVLGQLLDFLPAGTVAAVDSSVSTSSEGSGVI